MNTNIYNLIKEKNFVGTKNKRIPKTAFSAQAKSDKFYSKNAQVNLTTGTKVSCLADKIVTAIVDSQELNFDIFHGKNGQKNFYLGCFDKGSVSGPNYIYMELNDKGKCISSNTSPKFLATNMHSHYVFLMILAIKMYEKDKEIITNFDSIDFKSYNGMIEACFERELFTLNSAIEIAAEKIINGVHVGDLSDEEEYFQQFASKIVGKIDLNLTSLFVEKKVYTNASASIDIPTNIPNYEKPKQKPKKNISTFYKNLREKVMKKELFIYKSEEDLVSHGFPEELIIRWQSGQDAFAKYAHTLTEQGIGLIASMRKNISVACLTGEAGGGKTTIGQAVAGCLGLPLITINGNNDTDFASMILDYGAKDGSTYDILKPALLAYCYGGVVVIDEISRIKGETSTALNAMLDGRGFYDAPNGVQYKKSPNFKVICTMNQGIGYQTEELDTSLIDRFQKVLFVPDPTKELAVEIISEATNYKNKEIIGMLWDIKVAIDEKAKEEEYESRTSLRGVIDWINEAYITGEFVISATTTILGKLLLKDIYATTQNIDELSEGENLLVAFAVDEIKDQLNELTCDEEDFD